MPDTIIPKAGAFLAHIDKMTDAQRLAGYGELDPIDPDAETVKPRRMCPVPNPLLALLPDGTLSPEVFVRAVLAYVSATGPEVEADRVATYKQLSQFARASMLGIQAGSGVRPLESKPPPVFRLENDVLNARLDLVYRDLPDLRQGPPQPATAAAQPPQPSTGMTQQDLIKLLRDDRAAIRADAIVARQDKVKTAKDLLHGNPEAMMQLCNAATNSALPSVYDDMAQVKAADHLALCQRALDRVCMDDPTYTGDAPLLTLSIVRMALAPRYYSHDQDAMLDYLGPLLFCVGSRSTRAKTARVQDLATRLSNGDVGTLADIFKLDLLDKEGIVFPCTWQALKRTMMGFHFFCTVFIGAVEPIVKAYKEGIDTAVAMEQDLAEQIQDKPHLCLLVLRELGLELNMFHKAHARSNKSTTIPLPDFKSFWRQIVKGNWLPPTLPAEFRAAQAATLGDIPEGHSVQQGGTLPGSVGSGNPQGPAQPGPPTHVVPPPPGGTVNSDLTRPPGRTKGESIRRTAGNPQEAIVAAAGTGFVCKRVRKKFEDCWPINDEGHKMCLAWQVWGKCFTNCGCKGDHKEHNEGEDQVLLNFLTEKFGEFRN
jgi:hypothetical protein